MPVSTSATRRAQDEDDAPSTARNERTSRRRPEPEEEWDVGELDPRGPFKQRRWDDDSSMRGYLAIAATAIFAGTIIWACWQTGIGHWNIIKDLFQTLLPCETGFLGGAVTFYY